MAIFPMLRTLCLTPYMGTQGLDRSGTRLLDPRLSSGRTERLCRTGSSSMLDRPHSSLHIASLHDVANVADSIHMHISAHTRGSTTHPHSVQSHIYSCPCFHRYSRQNGFKTSWPLSGIQIGAFPQGGHVICTPEGVKHILKDAFDKYEKTHMVQEPLSDFLGNGIFTSDGKIWQLHRKVAVQMYVYVFALSSIHCMIWCSSH